VITFIPIIAIMFVLVNLIQQIGVLSRASVLLDEALSHFGISGRSVVNLLTGFGCNVPAILMSRSANSRKER
jgi:ferrous iron transport protein B